MEVAYSTFVNTALIQIPGYTKSLTALSISGAANGCMESTSYDVSGPALLTTCQYMYERYTCGGQRCPMNFMTSTVENITALIL